MSIWSDQKWIIYFKNFPNFFKIFPKMYLKKFPKIKTNPRIFTKKFSKNIFKNFFLPKNFQIFSKKISNFFQKISKVFPRNFDIFPKIFSKFSQKNFQKLSKTWKIFQKYQFSQEYFQNLSKDILKFFQNFQKNILKFFQNTQLFPKTNFMYFPSTY